MKVALIVLIIALQAFAFISARPNSGSYLRYKICPEPFCNGKKYFCYK